MEEACTMQLCTIQFIKWEAKVISLYSVGQKWNWPQAATDMTYEQIHSPEPGSEVTDHLLLQFLCWFVIRWNWTFWNRFINLNLRCVSSLKHPHQSLCSWTWLQGHTCAWHLHSCSHHSGPCSLCRHHSASAWECTGHPSDTGTHLRGSRLEDEWLQRQTARQRDSSLQRRWSVQLSNVKEAIKYHCKSATEK